MRTRHHEPRFVGHQCGVMLEELRFGEVVGLLPQLARGLGCDCRDVDVVRQQLRARRRSSGEIVDVAPDRARHARVLDLQRQFAAIDRARAMHLADRRGGNRLVVEVLEALLPALAVLAAEHARATASIGIGAACERRISSACTNSGGSRSSPCSDSIWPSFIAPPRRRARRAARRRALSAVRKALALRWSSAARADFGHQPARALGDAAECEFASRQRRRSPDARGGSAARGRAQ